MIFIKLLTLVLILTGCSGIKYTAKDGTTRHLIIGIGYITLNEKEIEGPKIFESTVMGAHFSNQLGMKFGLGYMNNRVLEIPKNTDMIINIENKIFSETKIETKTFK